MCKFIKLTRLASATPSYSNQPVYVSINAISVFYHYMSYTVIEFASESEFINVQETPECILKMIETAK